MRFLDIKVGDQVIIDGKVIAQVERVTKTQFTANGRRFLRNCGWQVGGSKWHFKAAEPATPELLEKVKRRMEQARIYGIADRLLNQLTTLLRSIDRNETPGDIAAAIPHLKAALFAMHGDTNTPTTTKDHK